MPLRALDQHRAQTGSVPSEFQFACVDTDDAIIEMAKKAEDDEAWVIWLYEFKQYRRNVTLTLGAPICKAVESHLLEAE